MLLNIYLNTVLLLALSAPGLSNGKTVTVYRVVINPGHGGISMEPQSKHGDRFDPVSRQYLDPFKYGAEYRGMSPVIAVPYSVLYRGLRHARDRERSIYFYKKFRYKNWCLSKDLREDWYCYLDDVSFYFTSYHLKDDFTPEIGDFRGYRHNMVTWAYSDDPGWEVDAVNHLKKSRYSDDYNDVMPAGRFWEREKSVYEKYRRAGGYYGYGGDNLYASYELIRFMQYYLHKKGVRYRDQSPGKPYIGTWIVPLHMNAVSPFFELGYLNRKGDRFILTRKQDVIAAGLAVGIYSLFAGLKVKRSGYSHRPAGRKVDFNKYIMRDGKSYFDIVVDK